MNRNVFSLLVAQFLTAFADNALLFAAITMVLQMAEPVSWYVPALQASFLVAYVFLAPWVGPYADARRKPRVLTTANAVKAVGASMMLVHVEPLLAYAVVGLGAAVYSPAKYGVLPELVASDELVKANGWIEGSTILAILLGSVGGSVLSNHSISLALTVVIVSYILSGATTLLIGKTPIVLQHPVRALPAYVTNMRKLLSTPRARFATLGVSLFWSAATVLRVLLVAWAPAVLMITNTTDIAMLTMFVAFGIAIGSVLVPKLIPLAFLRRARLAAYVMGVIIVGLSFVDNLWAARIALLLAGIAGGMFVVPINASLQEIGHQTIGSGAAVGIQNFFENFAMLAASGIYALAAGWGAGPVSTMLVLGVVVVIATAIVSWHLPPDTGQIDKVLEDDNAAESADYGLD
ncbi:MAG: lysophospholipid transporter LplT [Gammaproteobacteria bacterium]|jgi:LPLT family lysophospholipid transporter-like MFS transporter